MKQEDGKLIRREREKEKEIKDKDASSLIPHIAITIVS